MCRKFDRLTCKIIIIKCVIFISQSNRNMMGFFLGILMYIFPYSLFRTLSFILSIFLHFSSFIAMMIIRIFSTMYNTHFSGRRPYSVFSVLRLNGRIVFILLHTRESCSAIVLLSCSYYSYELFITTV